MALIVVEQKKDFDGLDIKIIALMMSGRTSNDIADKLKRPLSTIQRRVRIIEEKGFVVFKPQLDYSKMGLKKGLLHVYLQGGDLRSAAEKLSNLAGVLSASVHLGNSDVILEFLFRESDEVVDLISKVKEQGGVEKVVWSQEVHRISKPLELEQYDHESQTVGTRGKLKKS